MQCKVKNEPNRSRTLSSKTYQDLPGRIVMEPTAKAKTSVTEVMVTATPACERALPILSFRLNAWLKTLTLFQSNFYEENVASFIRHFKLSCGQFYNYFTLVKYDLESYWLENCQCDNSRVIIYHRKMFKRIDRRTYRLNIQSYRWLPSLVPTTTFQ